MRLVKSERVDEAKDNMPPARRPPARNRNKCDKCGKTTLAAGWHWNSDHTEKACHRRKCMREVGRLPPLASDKVGSMDADLLEIEEVLGMRYCDPSQMTAVALRNPVDEDDERLEYLVSGRFGSGPDDRGFHSVAWVFHGDLLDHADADTVKSAIRDYKNRLDKEFTALAEACDEADAE